MSKKKKNMQEAVPENEMEETVPEEKSGEQDAAMGEASETTENMEVSVEDELKKELDHYKDALLRERADFDNYKKRNALAVSKARNDGMMEAVEKFLPVLDNIERAISSATEDSPIKEGVELVRKQLVQILTGLGIEEIEAEGAVFDPNLHNAVMQVDGEEGEESGMIKQVFQKGYKHGDQVIRHSMVSVVR